MAKGTRFRRTTFADLLHLPPSILEVPLLVMVVRSILLHREYLALLVGLQREWPMNEQQINVVGLESLEDLVKTFGDATMVGAPDLGSDKEFFASDSRVYYALSDF